MILLSRATARRLRSQERAASDDFAKYAARGDVNVILPDLTVQSLSLRL